MDRLKERIASGLRSCDTRSPEQVYNDAILGDDVWIVRKFTDLAKAQKRLDKALNEYLLIPSDDSRGALMEAVGFVNGSLKAVTRHVESAKHERDEAEGRHAA